MLLGLSIVVKNILCLSKSKDMNLTRRICEKHINIMILLFKKIIMTIKKKNNNNNKVMKPQ
jgi:hypothetical protein